MKKKKPVQIALEKTMDVRKMCLRWILFYFIIPKTDITVMIQVSILQIIQELIMVQ